MNIALICTEKLPVPPIAGGAVQLYIQGIVPYLSKIHNITVFSIDNPGLPAEEVRESVRYIRVPSKFPQDFVQNVNNALDSRYDLIHVFNRPNWVLAFAEKHPKAKFSLSLHNEMFHPEKINNADALRCVQRVEFISTVSKFIADGVAARVPEVRGKIHTVYSGADIHVYKPAWTSEGMENKRRMMEKYRLEGYKVVLFVGRLSEKKGVHILLKALKTVMIQHPKTALVIVGSKWYGENTSNEYSHALEKLSKELTGPIVFTGFLPPSEIPSLYNLGDIFVCPSQWNEPLARVHYEAMAAGLPIITTNRGGNSEVIMGHKNGRIINDFKNPEVFASCIGFMLQNPITAAELGKMGRRHAEEKYNWKRVANDLLKLFSEIK